MAENRVGRLILLAGNVSFLLVLAASGAAAEDELSTLRFEVSFPAAAHAEAITGRVFVAIARKDTPEPRQQVDNWLFAPPTFGADVSALQPGQAATIDGHTLGFPLRSLADIPTGDYYAQAFVNVYTEFDRADGHAIWAHMDQWEGQKLSDAPGNLYSDVRKVSLDPRRAYTVHLTLSNVIPPVVVPPDTEWVKRVKIQSKLLSAFWGRPIYLGATVLLPRGYQTHPEVSYPVVYEQDHFTLRPAFNFDTVEPQESEAQRRARHAESQENSYELYQAWNSTDFPRLIAVRFQHPTPYFDDSYAVNSANNGPYGDALLTELIPYLEAHFRMIRHSYARALWGGSTGGWESLALELYHPDFFGGTWAFFPDSIDFRRYGMVNIYDDDSAFVESAESGNKHEWTKPERPLMRSADGQVETTMREFSQFEAVLGTRGRSGEQLSAWEAVYGPVGDDGYPKPLWDRLTGKIDHDVAKYMREHGYDLRYYAESNWPKLGPRLQGKLHLYCGDMDNFYLNLAVYLFDDFIKDSRNPHVDAVFEYGRPMKGHGWMPMTRSALARLMAEQITRNAPLGEDTSKWKYR